MAKFTKINQNLNVTGNVGIGESAHTDTNLYIKGTVSTSLSGLTIQRIQSAVSPINATLGGINLGYTFSTSPNFVTSNGMQYIFLKNGSPITVPIAQNTPLSAIFNIVSNALTSAGFSVSQTGFGTLSLTNTGVPGAAGNATTIQVILQNPSFGFTPVSPSSPTNFTGGVDGQAAVNIASLSVRNDGLSVFNGVIQYVDGNQGIGKVLTSTGSTGLATWTTLPISLTADTYWISGSSGTNSIKTKNNTAIDATANYAIAEGSATTASGVASHAEGEGSRAVGEASHAEGIKTFATNFGAHAEGSGTTASGFYGAHAEGRNTTAKGDDGSHAEGYLSVASGSTSHAEGDRTTASGHASHSEGQQTTAFGAGHAEGFFTIAGTQFSNFCHAEGSGSVATGDTSHAEGLLTISSGQASHAEGVNTIAYGDFSHTEGNGSYVAQTATAGHAEGTQTTALGQNTHVEGYSSIATGDTSHAEGNVTLAYGNYSHSQNSQTKAFGSNSHAEGDRTTASGDTSHAEGYFTIASGIYSHAEGAQTTAMSESSHAGGESTSVSGITSFIHSLNSKLIANRSVLLGGQNLTGRTDDTVYVPHLNINNVTTGTSIFNLGIAANGDVVTGTTGGGSDTYVTGGTYSTGTTIFTNNSGASFTVTGYSNVNKFTLTTGFTANTGLTITHNLGNKFITIALWDNGVGDLITGTVNNRTTNSVDVTLTSTLASVDIIIIG